ncbi:hypothetical protein MT1194 [Mycobacterium tuberculosis CDC1551]|uniref:Uncharacterized protein n=1 Tax=Mycobacterium tuberculosis (strain CDC 1551 / Oshkosh) TaxID=83331 RepID=Q8VK55_MYCTO|nr:hypothetical protein MT1194 [Mycobacterium tuberculosis CDC1551]
MPTIWTFVRAAAVLVGSSAALLTGGIAHADPAPAPAPAPNIPQQLISSAANAPQILQNLATALGATPPLSAPKVAEPAPAAPGITATFPGLTPAHRRQRGPRANSVHSRSERPDPGDNPGGTGAPRHRPGGSSDHSRSERPDPGDNRTGPGGGRGAGLRSRRAVGEGRPTAAALPSAPSAATAFAASRPTGARIGGHSGSAHRADAAGSRRARVTARAAVVARRAALTHL